MFSQRHQPFEYDPCRPTAEEIAALAFRYWQNRGDRPGGALEDWLDAERVLSKGLTAAPAVIPVIEGKEA